MRIYKASFQVLLLSFLTSLHFHTVKGLSWVQLFGLQDLVTDLVKAEPVVNYDGQKSVSYAVNPTLLNFLSRFQSRTDFCDYKCPSFYQMPCFILFQCNIQIRNFILIIISPILMIGLIGICCGRGIWTFGCWGKYIGLLTGIFFIIWFMKKFVKGYEIVQRRRREKQFFKEQRKLEEIQIEPVCTDKRMYEQQNQ